MLWILLAIVSVSSLFVIAIIRVIMSCIPDTAECKKSICKLLKQLLILYVIFVILVFVILYLSRGTYL